MKMMIWIKHVEKKSWCSKRYEISEWSFGDATLATEITFTSGSLSFSIEILDIDDDTQINIELYTFSNFF